MTSSSFQSASNQLWNCWQTGQVIDGLDPSIQPKNRQEGYAIQALLEPHSNKPLFGWKIAATSAAGQKHIGVDGPMAGRLLAEQVRSESDVISLTNNRMRVAECEFAFRMGRDLLPQTTAYSQTYVMESVASLHPSIEIPDSRFSRFEVAGEAQLIADNACAHLFILGKASTANWRAMNLSTHAVTATIEAPGKSPVHHHGVGSNVLGDPRIALTWLVNELRSLGIALKAGAVVTTGTCVVPIAVEPGQQLYGNFGALGEVSAKFG